MDRCLVLLSSYNGEEYIDEQIKSILRQKDVEVTLMIRDDGSADDTLKVIRNMNDKRIVVLKGENVGYRKSFFELIQRAGIEYDYYAFSDQDDVWLEDKIITAIKKLKDYNCPASYCSTPIYVNEKLKRIDGCHSSIDDLPEGVVLPEWMIHNSLAAIGCTFVWNRALQSILLMSDFSDIDYDLIAHDNFMSVFSSFVGILIKDQNGRILYRQHDNNTSGSKEEKRYNLKGIIKSIRELKNIDLPLRKYIFDNYKEYIPKDRIRLLQKSVDYTNSFSAFSYLFIHNCAKGLKRIETGKYYIKLLLRKL